MKQFKTVLISAVMFISTYVFLRFVVGIVVRSGMCGCDGIAFGNLPLGSVDVDCICAYLFGKYIVRGPMSSVLSLIAFLVPIAISVIVSAWYISSTLKKAKGVDA